MNGLLLSVLLADCPSCSGAKAAVSAATADGVVWPTVILSGLVDGFNPCAFSVVITLAGILAVGGRHRRARLWGGCAFCAGSYATYMMLGLGLLQALRSIEGLVVLRTTLLVVLATTLFSLSYLSLQDALRYRRERTPAAITLQLPGRVKRWIRAVAESSWSGTSVVLAGLACGMVVTLLDSLCTGQVYVPVLTILAGEPRQWRVVMYLAVYNLAFILPLVTVFALAAKGADSATMSRWSKRNVVPAKLALAALFLVLGLMLMPRFGGALARAVDF